MRETTCFPVDVTHLLEGEGTTGYIFWSNSAPLCHSRNKMVSLSF